MRQFFLRWGAIAAATGAAALITAACSDSLHLDPDPVTPTGAGGGGGQVSVGVGGEDAGLPIACSSNSDCPAPTAVCDTVKNECKQCLEIADCAFRPGTVCSLGICACPVTGEEFCGASGGQPARCVDPLTSPTDCGSCGHACFGACNAGSCADPWEPTSLVDAPASRARHVAVSTGTTMIVWGGDTPNGVTASGGIYNPGTRKWTPISTANAPSARARAKAVWTGTVMLVFGGLDGSGALNTGGRFDPATNTWAPMAAGPGARYHHTAVWMEPEKKMIVWGGYNGAEYLNTGGVYDLVSDTWTLMPGDPDAPAREDHAAVAGPPSTMLMYAGFGDDGMGGFTFLAGGAAFSLTTMDWVPLDPTGQPTARRRHAAAWDGTQMLITGGFDGASYWNDGGKYNPGQNSWSSLAPAPLEARQFHTAVWIDGTVKRMLLWGGEGPALFGSGGIYDPAVNQWKIMPTAPAARAEHSAVVTGEKMIIWGGNANGGVTNSGAIFDPAFTP